MSAPKDALTQLAEAHGVSATYVDNEGVRRSVAPATIIAALAALDVAARTSAEVDEALRDVRRRGSSDLPPCVVAREGEPGTLRADGPIRSARLFREDGASEQLSVSDDGTVQVTDTLPCGYHRIEVNATDGPRSLEYIVVPRFLGFPERARRRQWGFAAQLYSVRSAQSWAIGDFADLAEIAEWSAATGAGFLLTNPLHAAEPSPPMSPSPYSPSSRRYLNPIYVRPEALPEYAAAPAAVRAEVDRLRDDLNRAVGARDTVDRDAAWTAKSRALRLLFDAQATARPIPPDPQLRRFATWCALVARHGKDPSAWPTATSVEDELTRDIDFYQWLQAAARQQLESAQDRARAAGMAIGIVTDLAVGVGTDSAEVWTDAERYADGVTIGAPGDAYNRLGQGWGLAAWRPDALAAAAYRPFRDLVRGILRGCGGVRIDHIMGLFRLWWIPEGNSPADGVYVHYDHDALVGILLLEAQRADAVIVGEDLGTVEPWVRDYLTERGLLGTSVLWFERTSDGQPLPADRYRELCMASVTTHDLAPTAGYLRGAHIDVRARLGLLGRPAADERADLDRDLRSWRRVLAAAGLLPAAEPAPDDETMILALHRYLAASPARLICAALGDAVGDLRLQNQPGTSDEYPNWRVPLTDADGRPVWVEQLRANGRAARFAAALTEACRH